MKMKQKSAKTSLVSSTHSPSPFYYAELIWWRGKGLATLAAFHAGAVGQDHVLLCRVSKNFPIVLQYFFDSTVANRK